MRVGKRGFGARIKGDLRIEFGQERLTSHAGLELFRRYLREGGLAAHLRRSEQRPPENRNLRDRAAFAELLARAGAELVIHG